MWRWVNKIRLSLTDRLFKRQKIPEAEVSGLPDISAIVPMVEVEHIVVPPLVRIEADFDDEKESRRKAVRISSTDIVCRWTMPRLLKSI